VVWVTNLPGGEADVFYTRSTDGGATFEPLENLSEYISIATTFPRISASGSNVYVVWVDTISKRKPLSGILDYSILLT
jgi:hypothetical protein